MPGVQNGSTKQKRTFCIQYAHEWKRKNNIFTLINKASKRNKKTEPKHSKRCNHIFFFGRFKGVYGGQASWRLDSEKIIASGTKLTVAPGGQRWYKANHKINPSISMVCSLRKIMKILKLNYLMLLSIRWRASTA